MEKDMQLRILDFIKGTDMDFYEAFLVNLSVEDLQKFLEDNPDFLMQ